MAIASGVAKQLRYKQESTWNTAAGTSTGKLLRRVESTLDLSKDTYVSNEIRTDYQISDFRHGVRRVTGNIRGELSPGTYADFFGAALRRDFAAVVSLTGLSLTIAGTAPNQTITRGSGDFLTGGIKIGHVIRLTAGSFTAGNLNNNMLVTAVTATVLTVRTLNASTITNEGPIASATVAVTGKCTYTPTTSQTDRSYSIEHWHSDIAQSELFTGCKVSSLALALPPSGMATVDWAMMGGGITTATAEYFATGSLTAATTTGCIAAVNGVLLVGGSAIATCTGLSINYEGGMTADPVVGSNSVPFINPGRVNVTGQFTAYFENATLRDYFINETAVSLVAALTASNDNNADFICISLPRIKVGGASKNDGERGLVATFPFQALYNSAGGTGISTEATTMYIQDSQA